MPLPRALARFNRRVTNRVARPVAARAPGLAIVVHRGRATGREYRTPVNVFAAGDGYVIALTYGSGSDWVRNVMAAGGCTLLRRGRRYPLGNARVVGVTEAKQSLPLPVRGALRLLRVREYLMLDSDLGDAEGRQ